LSEDILGPIPINLFDPRFINIYTYASNDPINFVDPLGLLSREQGEAIGKAPSLIKQLQEARAQTRFLNEGVSALDAVSRTIPKGQTVDAYLIADPNTGQVLGVDTGEGSITKPGTLVVPVKIEGTGPVLQQKEAPAIEACGNIH